MTIGHLVECVYAKLCCLEGYLGDGTIYIDIDHKSIYDNLEKNNYHKHGNEILYNGQTGRQIHTEIFIGPTYYFRLKHMVAEKINARGKGPMTQLTRQPTGGRRKEGGLRIGEMERDSLISHGIAGFIQESMMERSDKYRWQVCKRCGIIPNYSKKINSCICPLCEGNESSIIETPYCMKLLNQELEAMNLQMRFNCDYTELPNNSLEILDDDHYFINDDNYNDNDNNVIIADNNKKKENKKGNRKNVKKGGFDLKDDENDDEYKGGNTDDDNPTSEISQEEEEEEGEEEEEEEEEEEDEEEEFEGGEGEEEEEEGEEEEEEGEGEEFEGGEEEEFEGGEGEEEDINDGDGNDDQNIKVVNIEEVKDKNSDVKIIDTSEIKIINL
jgi:DNA-directed RNA polymerase II subunit RPB2